MAGEKGSEPRAHHIVPRFWLAGFTENGEKDGRLWVTDLKRRKQWPSNPGKIGYINDFYRIAEGDLDPVIVETALSKMEGIIAPILRGIDRERRAPRRDEMEELFEFIAIQWVRVPAFRVFARDLLEKFTQENVATALESEQSWIDTRKRVGIPIDAPGGDYRSMKEFWESGEHSLRIPTEWYMLEAFKAAGSIAPLLRKRYWGAAISPSGSFIGTDNPVIMDAAKGEMSGFVNAEVIFYQLSRHVLLYGVRDAIEPPFVNRKYIAHMNTFAMIRAQEQVFSPVPDFGFLDEAQKYQSNWELFSKDKILASVPD